jgi:hypothetical protein
MMKWGLKLHSSNFFYHYFTLGLRFVREDRGDVFLFALEIPFVSELYKTFSIFKYSLHEYP